MISAEQMKTLPSPEISGIENQISNIQDGLEDDIMSIKKAPIQPKRPPVNQSISMNDDRIEILR